VRGRQGANEAAQPSGRASQPTDDSHDEPAAWMLRLPTGALPGFAVAAAAAAAHLNRQLLGMDSWVVTCVEQDRQLVIARAGAWAELGPAGAAFSWQASFCVRMVSGQSPAVAPGTGVGIAVGGSGICAHRRVVSRCHRGAAGQSKTCLHRHARGGQLTQRVFNIGLLHRLDGYVWPD
jgi:hypothetical protein